MKSLRPSLRISVAVLFLATLVVAATGLVDVLGALLDPDRRLAGWPGTAFDRFQAAALLVLVLAGMLALLRLGLAGLHAPGSRLSPDLERLRSEVRTDTLTKLANRRAFDADLAAAAERRNHTGTPFSLMAIDLDGLKQINDTQGHQAGDERLCWIADRLESAIGSRGTAYRTGGDEFMVLLPGTRALHAVDLAHAVQRATTTPGASRALSIGVTETRGTEHRAELMRQADVALYEAKREGLPVATYRPDLEGAPAPTDQGPRRSAAVKALTRALEARDAATAGHSEAVAVLAVEVGRRQGLGGRRLEQLRLAALLHDVGKIGVPDGVLHKIAPLTDEDRLILRRHVSIGRNLVAAAGFPDESTWVRHHHESYDGSGYPDGLRGDAIPLEARIIAVVDAYEAMTATRPYGDLHTTKQALRQLHDLAGARFDPACVEALTAAVGGTSADHQPCEHDQDEHAEAEEEERIRDEVGHGHSHSGKNPGRPPSPLSDDVQYPLQAGP